MSTTTKKAPTNESAVKFPHQKAYTGRLIQYREEALHLRERVVSLETKVETLVSLLARTLAIETEGREGHANESS